VRVTPARDGWAFDPVARSVFGAATDINFSGSPSGGIGLDDLRLESAVRKAISRPTGPIRVEDVAALRLRIAAFGVWAGFSTSLPGGTGPWEKQDTGYRRIITTCQSEGAVTSWNEVSNIAELSALTSLEQLYLRVLAFYENEVSDITPLARLTNLEVLGMRDNMIASIAPVSGFSRLEELYFENNQVRDISRISGLTRLRRIDLDMNQVSDISPIFALTSLNEFCASNNQIHDIQPLSGLTNLRKLSLWGNRIENIQPLVDNAGLDAGDEVDIRYNPLDITPGSQTMQNINALIARGVDLKYSSGESLEPLLDAPLSAVGCERNLSTRRVDWSRLASSLSGRGAARQWRRYDGSPLPPTQDGGVIT